MWGRTDGGYLLHSAGQAHSEGGRRGNMGGGETVNAESKERGPGESVVYRERAGRP